MYIFKDYKSLNKYNNEGKQINILYWPKMIDLEFPRALQKLEKENNIIYICQNLR